jgi:hypothetical protein
MTTNFNVNDLTTTQQQRYYSLIDTYGDRQAIDIVKGLTNRGKSSYAVFVDKSEAVIKAKHDEQDYFTALYEAFELNKPVTPGDVIRIVGIVRRTLELDAYKTKLKIRSEADFFQLFVFEELYVTNTDTNGNEFRTLTGYNPIARVRPEVSDDAS